MDSSERSVAALATGRIVLGAASIAAPEATVRAFGMAPRPELVYMTQIFGARAIALGVGWWRLRGRERRMAQRVALVVDLSDTAAGLTRLRARDVPRASALSLLATTGGYALVGLARLAHDLRER
jgi:hypothetical protein